MTAAQYADQRVARYRNNPWLEALPPIPPYSEIEKALATYPSYDPSERSDPETIREHHIQTLREVVIPLEAHIDLATRFDRMLREGYVGRNPDDPSFRARIDHAMGLINKLVSSSGRAQAPHTGLSVLGASGVGKSTAVRSALGLYPQVIEHSEFRGKPLVLAQVVWLKLDCPYDGSLGGLCFGFFEEVDKLLGTDYTQRYTRGSVERMLVSMARIVEIHGIGLIVIDEIQQLNQAKSGGAERMLNFFVHLVNTIGLPVVFVGVPSAKRILQGTLRQSRRSPLMGWNRMQPGDDWNRFCRAIWKYQYLATASPLTAELSDTLYEESQGIIAFVVQLYELAQLRAIARRDSKITPDTIRSVAKDELKLARPMLDAMKSKNVASLQSFDDATLDADEDIRLARQAEERRDRDRRRAG